MLIYNDLLLELRYSTNSRKIVAFLYKKAYGDDLKKIATFGDIHKTVSLLTYDNDNGKSFF